MFKHTLKPTACSGRKSARWVCKRIDQSRGWPPLPPRRRGTVCETQWERSGRCRCTGPTGITRIYMKTQAMSFKNLQKEHDCTNKAIIVCTRKWNILSFMHLLVQNLFKINHAVETCSIWKKTVFYFSNAAQLQPPINFNYCSIQIFIVTR